MGKVNNKKKYKVGQTFISITSPEDTRLHIESAIKQGITTHICVSDFRAICYASNNSEYKDIMLTSALNLPDGMPLIWLARLWGIWQVQHTKGPDLFVSMIKNPNNGIKHFLLGDTVETLDHIERKYKEEYASLIVGTYSPPFIDINDYDYESIANIINASGADVVWISMTAPKQDFFAVNIKPWLDKKILIGVGAAFRYSIGLYKIPNLFFQKIGMTGILMRQHSWWKVRWYFKHIFLLMGFALQIIGWRIAGRKYYE